MDHTPEDQTPSAAEPVPTPTDVAVNPLVSREAWQAMREACVEDPAGFHGSRAKGSLHWFHPDQQAWLTETAPGCWAGWRQADAQALSLEEDWTPWHQAFDDSAAPFYRWFRGGLTNAAFNEVDRHVAAGYGEEVALWFEGDRWDPAANGGKGGPVHHRSLTRRELLIQSVVCAQALLDLGLKAGDRLIIAMPAIQEQVVWTEAAKRLGLIYIPVSSSIGDKGLSDRIEDSGAQVILTTDGASVDAEIVPLKALQTDRALERYISAPTALALLEQAAQERCSESLARRLIEDTRLTLADELTVAPSDIMQLVGRVLQEEGLTPTAAAALRADLAEALIEAPERVRQVIVVRHANLRTLPWNQKRDLWAEDLITAAQAKVCAAAGVASMGALRALRDQSLVRQLWRAVPPCPVEADWPLFILYTVGTGANVRPKGLVHVHGGYTVGVLESLRVAFDAQPGRDSLYALSDLGWIIGQSYLLTGPLAGRIPAVIAEGSPLSPHAGRFASIIERHGITLFLGGVTFLKRVMSDPESKGDVRHYNTASLRVALFCSEPVTEAVQTFAMDLLTPHYGNAYWATEHGAMAWVHPYGNPDMPHRADTQTHPLPWIMGDVWVAEGEADAAGRYLYRLAELEERGEVVITAPFPALARTIWGEAERFGTPDWRGDFDRFSATYFSRFRDEEGYAVLAYVQGDFARCYEDGSFSFHGRSDDMISVDGHRLGIQEIEAAILRDKQANPDSPVINCLVVAVPDRRRGQIPVAFVQPAAGRSLDSDDIRRLQALVRVTKGAAGVPGDILNVTSLPESHTGLALRPILSALMRDEPLGDTSVLRNPDCLPELMEAVADWKRRHARVSSDDVIEHTRYLSLRYDLIGNRPDGYPIRIAILAIDNPPDNALAEGVLDELDTELNHLARRDDIGAIVLTGMGSRYFAAGADLADLAERVRDAEEARALPSKAHAAFDHIECLGKPVIAALQGPALGAGLELALACHYRIGCSRTDLALPEIGWFLPPGFGALMRLPRLMMAARPAEEQTQALSDALGMILSGRRIDAEQALRWGLLDRLTSGSEDTLTLALALAREAALVLGGLGEGIGPDVGGPALAAMQAREKARSEWSYPGPFPTEVVQGDYYIALCCWQADSVGRGPVGAAILDTVRLGIEEGFEAGQRAEIAAFADFMIDTEKGGRRGLKLYLEHHLPPLPARPRPRFSKADLAVLEAKGELLPIGHPFLPGSTPLPRWQYAYAVCRRRETGEPLHGRPATKETQEILPIASPGPNQALVYMLASEVNITDIAAITGVPFSPFERHDSDTHVTGSGGVGLVAALGEALQAEGRLSLGDLVILYAGVSDLLDPAAGQDPMVTTFRMQGFDTPDGTHQQFVVVDGPQMFHPPSGLALEQAGSFITSAATVYRGLYNKLDIRAGRRLFVEGAATGIGAWGVRLGLASRLRVTGLVSSPERLAAVETLGAFGIDRSSSIVKECFSRVPADPSRWILWEGAGAPFLRAVRQANNGELCHYALSHVGELIFPRTFQALAEGGSLALLGANGGVHMTFIGKPGSVPPADMLHHAALKPGETVLVFYGDGATGEAGSKVRDDGALAAIEAAREAGARIAVVTDTDVQREFVQSLGFGEALAGAVSLAEIQRHTPDFHWPETLPDLPDPSRDATAFRQALLKFSHHAVAPLASVLRTLLISSICPEGQPDVVVERAHKDSLAVSLMLTRPYSGRVVYCDDMAERRYSFPAHELWLPQRRILMPNASIIGSHLSNAAEVLDLNRLVETGLVQVPPPYVGEWSEVPEIHQAICDNRLREAFGGRCKAVINHALPDRDIRDYNELIASWALGETEA